MLAKQFRLPSSVVLRDAQNIRSDPFIVRYQKNNLPYSRFGFVVAKKIDKRATVRNSLKRLVRSVIEAKWVSLQGWDVLFVLRPSIKQQTKEQIKEAVEKAMLSFAK